MTDTQTTNDRAGDAANNPSPEVVVSAAVWTGDRAPLAKALVAAQLACEAVKKGSVNPAFKSRYADLAAVVEAVVPALNANGVAMLQFVTNDDKWVSVETMFLHESGSSLSSTLSLKPTKTDPQGVASASTYARRYSLLGMSGAAPEDDDGNGASAPRQQRRDASEAKVTMEQANELADLIVTTGSDSGRFLAFFAVPELEALPATRYREAVAMLNAKIKEAA